MPCEVLLYYKFTHIADPRTFRDIHHRKCLELGIKGRVYVASEGINGTVAGVTASIREYKSFLTSHPGLHDIAFKMDKIVLVPFEKMKTKVRPHILNMGLKPEDDVDPSLSTGKHLSPKEWRRTLEVGGDYLLLDIRNNYETAIGRFKDAILPELGGFTEFPAWATDLEKYRAKKILMYCTGGIRCEKFSSLLLERGFSDVNQLSGGILNYAKEEGGAHFEGRCFVFDDRLAVDVADNATPIAKCRHCGTNEDKYVNCANMDCNALFIVCDACAEKYQGACCDSCLHAPQKRPFDPKNCRIPFRKKGVVFPELGRKHGAR